MGRKGKELSPEVKQIARDLFEEGHSIREISRILQKPKSTIFSFLKQSGLSGAIENTSRGGRPLSINTPPPYVIIGSWSGLSKPIREIVYLIFHPNSMKIGQFLSQNEQFNSICTNTAIIDVSPK